MKVKALLILFASCFSLFALSGCGTNATGSNAELDVKHSGAPDCTQSGCHADFGAGGTVFTNPSSGTAVSGVTVRAQSISTGATATLGVSDVLGNFYYESDLSGYYNLSIGGKPWSGAHNMPEYSGCNRCHKWPSAGGSPGKLN